MLQQIPFSFTSFDRVDFDQFLAGQNQQILDYLQRLLTGRETDNVFLWGEAGTGKSHLLQAACTYVSTQGKRSGYIPLSQIDELTPEMLEGLDQLDLVCIDDLDLIAGNEAWELAVFHLFNRLREQQHPLILAAHASPQGLQINLSDLKSRLTWDMVYHLQVLTEGERLKVLQQRAKLRGFDLPDEVADYLLKRISRDMHSLFSWLNKLDEASLSEKKKLTVPFVKNILDLTDK